MRFSRNNISTSRQAAVPSGEVSEQGSANRLDTLVSTVTGSLGTVPGS